ncbi:hypothetical protein HYX04_04860 [Candidatus Woesearchaeota archaeon]|nr:hypothetical protein [Candidatus Woesearchaeota archaeon]
MIGALVERLATSLQRAQTIEKEFGSFLEFLNATLDDVEITPQVLNYTDLYNNQMYALWLKYTSVRKDIVPLLLNGRISYKQHIRTGRLSEYSGRSSTTVEDITKLAEHRATFIRTYCNRTARVLKLEENPASLSPQYL